MTWRPDFYLWNVQGLNINPLLHSVMINPKASGMCLEPKLTAGTLSRNFSGRNLKASRLGMRLPCPCFTWCFASTLLRFAASFLNQSMPSHCCIALLHEGLLAPCDPLEKIMESKIFLWVPSL